MKIFNIIAVLLITLFSSPAFAQEPADISNYEYVSFIKFNETKEPLYKSNYFNLGSTDFHPFEIALDTPDAPKGSWSMVVTDPTPKTFTANSKEIDAGVEKQDVTGQLFYVGMRFKFDK